MKLLLDENIPFSFKRDLKKAGYDVEHVIDKNQGKKDEDIFNYAVKNKKTIISYDSDYLKFRIREHYGIIKLNGKLKNPMEVLIELLNKIKTMEYKNVLYQIDLKKVICEKKVYSKRKHIFKQYVKTFFILDCM